jgi:ABC-type Mn2+/Zn2+ transport system ATPase subunit
MTAQAQANAQMQEPILFNAKFRSPDLLLLDEPTNSLDLVASKALKDELKAWQHGIVIAGRDKDFFDAIGVDKYLYFGESISLKRVLYGLLRFSIWQRLA